jgi:serine/threonine protein kinase/Tfp pilus assembly protein PilF
MPGDARWEKVEQIYNAALERPEAERAAFLGEACGGDEELRRDLESLLGHAKGAGDFLEPPAPAASVLAAGRRLSAYRVVSKLGAGGMGEVYLAEDTRLGRRVALKVLPRELATDPALKARLIHEARAASALNHPNIVALHDIGSEGGIDFLVMEYVAGKPLSELIPRKGMPVKEALRCGVQIADALTSAHAAGIVHRDLKPGNVMVTQEGLAKVLDFGLAKKFAVGPQAETQTQLTTQGAILGTVDYMSPEQAEGKPVDARSDIFSFGTLLYEMVTGRRPFERDSNLSTLAAILYQQPKPVRELAPHVPAELQQIVGRCLRKDPSRRFQHIDDVKVLLEDLRQEAGVPVPPERAPRRRRWFARLWRIAIPVLLVAVLAVVGYYYRSHQTKPLTDKDSIVLSDFTNTTGDSVFDDTLKQGLSVQLEQSPFLALVSERRVNETLKLMGRPAGERLTPEVTREVCQRTGSKAMLTGSIAKLGSQYVIGLKALNCNTGDVLAEAQEQAASKEAVLKALDAAAISSRSKLGESLSSVEKYATPVEEATTPSLEALKVYSRGLKTFYAKGGTAALPFFKRAVELDPNFAMAYAWMAVVYHDRDEIAVTAENGRKAYGLREKVSERERFFIDSIYYDLVTEDLEKGAQSDELWQQTYPRDDSPYIQLGFDSATLGNWEKALEEWRVAQRLDPDRGAAYCLLSLAYMSRNQLDEAEAVFKQAEERKLEAELLLQSRYWLAFLKGDAAQMARMTSAAMGKPGLEDLLLAMQADTEGWYGKLRSAHELTWRAMDSAQHNSAKESAAGYQAEAALRELESGNWRQARAEAQAALKLAPNRDVRVIAALALARAGDAAGAEKLAAELDRTFPLDTLVQRYWLPSIRAGVALDRNDPNRAIELLKVASPIELSSATGDLTIFLCPVYVRGEAYLVLHDGSAAAAEFQKFIDHRGVVMNFPWGALARLGLARAYALQGDTAKARAAYRVFLTIWKDADPDIPILKAAKAEYAKLQ